MIPTVVQLNEYVLSKTPDSFKQALAAVEHKISILEIRKNQIQTYLEDQQSGRTLTDYQQSVVDKLDDVQVTLDNFVELLAQFKYIACNAVHMQEQRAITATLDNMRQSTAKIKEILGIQDVLQKLRIDSVREDFLAGRNNAVQLTEEDLEYLDEFYVEISLMHSSADDLPSFQDQLEQSAEHLLALCDGEMKEVGGTTYAKLKELIVAIQSCGYFDSSLRNSAKLVNGDVIQVENNVTKDNCEAQDTSNEQQVCLWQVGEMSTEECSIQEINNDNEEVVNAEEYDVKNQDTTIQVFTGTPTTPDSSKEETAQVEAYSSPQMTRDKMISCTVHLEKINIEELLNRTGKHTVHVQDTISQGSPTAQSDNSKENASHCEASSSIETSDLQKQVPTSARDETAVVRKRTRSCVQSRVSKKKVRCLCCQEETFCNKSLLQNRLKSSPGKTHGCSVCRKTFSTMDDLKAHMFEHSNADKLFPCPICKEKFFKKSYLGKHIIVHF